VRSWQLPEIETPDGSRSPVVLHSSEEGRAVLIGLNPGQELGDHQVKEHAFIVVADGSVRIEAGDETLEAGPGTLVKF
jgi:quercetin dioxygenase-like cupin family protein